MAIKHHPELIKKYNSLFTDECELRVVRLDLVFLREVFLVLNFSGHRFDADLHRDQL
jgi:hypothetical protein